VIAQQEAADKMGGRVSAFEYGGAVTAVFPSFDTGVGALTPQVGIESKVRYFTIAGDYVIQDPQISLTFGMEYNSTPTEDDN